jgi:hypothetical protein
MDSISRNVNPLWSVHASRGRWLIGNVCAGLEIARDPTFNFEDQNSCELRMMPEAEEAAAYLLRLAAAIFACLNLERTAVKRKPWLP